MTPRLSRFFAAIASTAMLSGLLLLGVGGLAAQVQPQTEQKPAASATKPETSAAPGNSKNSAEASKAETSQKLAKAPVSMNARRDSLLIIVFCIGTVALVLWPIVRYLARPWSFRKDRLFGAINGDAVVYYYNQFRPGARVVHDYPIPAPVAAPAPAPAPAVAAPPPAPVAAPAPAPAPVVAAPPPAPVAAPAPAPAPPLAQAPRFGAISARYMEAFKRDFYHWYGRRYYIVPVFMLAVLTAVSAYWAQRMLRIWAVDASGLIADTSAGRSYSLRALVAAALAGAFVWVISDEIDRLRTHDFTTSDVYYYIFRILLSVPFAWAIAAFSVDGKVLGLPAAVPIAFFLGCFPTDTLFTIGRRFVSQQMKLGDDPDKGNLELEKLQAIGKSNAERFKDEGIATIVQLAYADPIDLTIRTNFDLSYVIDSVSQALAWIYLQDDLEKLFEFSIRGAQEVYWTTSEADYVDNPADPENALKGHRRNRAQAAIAASAAKLFATPQQPVQQQQVDAFRVTLDEIAGDPYTEFLVNIWT